jgi:hypothetical protein
MTWQRPAAITTRNRESRRLARKLGLKLDELLWGFSTGHLEHSQRRVREGVRQKIRELLEATKKDLAAQEKPINGLES